MFQTVLQVIPDDKRVLLELFSLEHSEHREPRSRAHGVTAERIEIAASSQHVRDFASRDDGSEGDSISNALAKTVKMFKLETFIKGKENKTQKKKKTRLCHRNNVGDHAVSLEPPEVASGPRKSRLHLVGDAKPSGFPNAFVNRREVTGRQFDYPPYTLPCIQRVMLAPEPRAVYELTLFFLHQHSYSRLRDLCQLRDRF